MDADEYQRLALKTEETPDLIPPHPVWVARLLHGSMGMTGEAGEVSELLKKHLLYGAELDVRKVMAEVGDILWYVALALDAVGCTMSQAMEANIAKLKARYGDKFTKEAAVKRGDEQQKRESEAIDARLESLKRCSAQVLPCPHGCDQNPCEHG